MKIFLDFDGTIIDSRLRLYKLFCDLTNSNALTFNDYWLYKKDMYSNEWLLNNIYEFKEVDVKQFSAAWFEKIESDEYLKYDELFNFTIESLKILVSLNIECNLITARQFPDKVEAQLINLGIKQFFSNIYVTGKHKSKIDSLSDTAINSTDYFVGDTGLDIQTAKAFGAISVAVLTGFRNEKVLKSYNPDIIANDLHEFCTRIFFN